MYKNTYPISLRLFFELGDPTSICEAFMDNFNGMVHKIPRAYIYESKLQEEIKKPGVYFLTGINNGEHKLYVGESEDVLERIKSHEKDEKRSWFSDVIVITSEQDYLNKAKVKYLENIYYDLATKAGRYTLEQTIPTKSKLSKVDEGSLVEFVKKTKMMISALGYKFFDEVEAMDEINNERVYFYYKKGTKQEAKGYRTKEGFVVCKGSFISPTEVRSIHSWVKNSRDANKDKIIDNYLMEDLSFNSSSFAIGFVTGSSRSGNNVWTTAENMKLGEYIGVY